MAILLKYNLLVIKVATLYTVLIKVIIKLNRMKKNKSFTDSSSSTGISNSFSAFKITGTATARITGMIAIFAINTDEKYSLASFFLP